MRKLLFFGDSFVQGNGLSGLDHTADFGTYSKETFPTLTANLLNLQYENLGFGGTSICDTTTRILETDIKKNDIVCVLWPESSRVGKMPNKEKKLSTFCSADDQNHVVDYYRKYWSEEKSLYDAKVNIAVANSYVTSKFGICINIPGVWTQQKEFVDQYIYDWADISYITESLCDFKIDVVADGHYGPETHKSFAEYLSKFISSYISIL